MAAPNIANLSTVTGKTNQISLTTATATSVLSNAASSGKVFKVNMLRVTNVDGTDSVNITVKVHSAAAGGGTGYEITSTQALAADTYTDIITKDNTLYIEEDRSISVTASAADDAVVVVSYEEIS